MVDSSTALDQVSSEVPDSAVLERDEKAHRLATLQRVAPALRDIAERIGLIERAMGGMLPDVVKEQPLGVVVDLLYDIKSAIETLHGDGSTVVTNRLKSRLDYAREVSLPERLDADGVKNFSTDNVRVAKSIRVLASILPDKKDDAFDWLRHHDLGSLIKPTVNASSLSAAAKEIMEKGEELPEELFRTHTKTSVSFTAVKKGRGG